jgi:hypothetical protein
MKPSFWCRTINAVCYAPTRNDDFGIGTLPEFEKAVQGLYAGLYDEAMSKKMAVLTVTQFTNAATIKENGEPVMQVLFYLVAQVVPLEELERQHRVSQLGGGSRAPLGRA